MTVWKNPDWVEQKAHLSNAKVDMVNMVFNLAIGFVIYFIIHTLTFFTMEFPLTGTIKSILVVGAYTLIETWFLVTIILIYRLRNVLLNIIALVLSVLLLLLVLLLSLVVVVGVCRWCLSFVFVVRVCRWWLMFLLLNCYNVFYFCFIRVLIVLILCFCSCFG